MDLFLTVMLLEDTLAVLSLGKLCEDHGYSCEWTRTQKPQLIKDGVHRPALWAQIHQHPQYHYRKKQKFLHCIPPQQEVRVRVAEYGETRRKKQQKPKTQKRRQRHCTVNGRKNLERILWMKVFQLIGEEKVGIGQARYLYPLPEGLEFRHLHEDQDNKNLMSDAAQRKENKSGLPKKQPKLDNARRLRYLFYRSSRCRAQGNPKKMRGENGEFRCPASMLCKTDPTKGAFLIGYSPSLKIWRTWETHVPRTSLWKRDLRFGRWCFIVETQKRKHSI